MTKKQPNIFTYIDQFFSGIYNVVGKALTALYNFLATVLTNLINYIGSIMKEILHFIPMLIFAMGFLILAVGAAFYLFSDAIGLKDSESFIEYREQEIKLESLRENDTRIKLDLTE